MSPVLWDPGIEAARTVHSATTTGRGSVKVRFVDSRAVTLVPRRGMSEKDRLAIVRLINEGVRAVAAKGGE